MRRLKDYTPEEKIKIFDSLYKQCSNSFQTHDPDEDDCSGFWECVCGEVLNLTDSDWKLRNSR